MIFYELFVVHHVSDYLPLCQNGGTEVQIGMERTAACFSRPQYQAVKDHSAGAHLQRTEETIAPSAFICFIAASTSLRSRPLSSAILPALRANLPPSLLLILFLLRPLF